MIYLDTHVVVWLYAGEVERFSETGRSLLERESLLISPMVMLELTYLREIKKVTIDAALMVDSLGRSIGLGLCDASFVQVVLEGMQQTWTRDPFDRMIVAQAVVQNAQLLTKDKTIRKHYHQAVW